MPFSFDYATIRVVPRVDREEFINAGVVVYCQERRYLAAAVHVDETRLRALWPALDLALVRQHLEAIPRICEGDATAGAIAKLSLSARFHWLTSPRSTIIQVSPVRTGICNEPDDLLARLVGQLLQIA